MIGIAVEAFAAALLRCSTIDFGFGAGSLLRIPLHGSQKNTYVGAAVLVAMAWSTAVGTGILLSTIGIGIDAGLNFHTNRD